MYDSSIKKKTEEEMKVLVATEKTQGKRRNDFCFVPEGEIVIFGAQCTGEAVDGKCGCRRSMTGVKCGKATTTMQVVEREITPMSLKEMIIRHMQKAGYGSGNNILAFADEVVSDLSGVVENFPLNSVLEKRGRKFNRRS